MNKLKIKIEIQHFDDCPNSPKLIQRVKEAIKYYVKNIQYEEILVTSNEEAQRIGFRGSPTLLINGKDIEDLPVPKEPALMCRFYSDGLPSVDAIKKVLDSFAK